MSLGVSKDVFLELCKQLHEKTGLQDSRYITREEKVAIFLYFGRHAAGQRDIAERFQHSGETISEYA